MHELPARPDGVPEDLAQLHSTVWPIIMECWAINPDSRPTAETMAQKLREGLNILIINLVSAILSESASSYSSGTIASSQRANIRFSDIRSAGTERHRWW
jgi:hypothetical protein